MRNWNKREFVARFINTFFHFEGSPLKMYGYQNRFLLDDSPFRIVMKARQLGYSFVIAAEGLAEALIQPYQTILFVSSGEEAAKRVLKYAYSLIDGMPLKPKMVNQSMTEMSFHNKSRIISLPNNDRTVRGFRANKVYCDEFASLMNDKEILAAIQPSISRGGEMTVLSTPRGRANEFWNIWSNNHTYSKHRVPWWLCPDKNYQRMVKRIGKSMIDMDFKQEYCCDPCDVDMAFFTRALLEPLINPSLHYVSSLDEGNEIIMGIDFGKKVSSTVITVVERCSDGFVRMRLQEELRNMPYDFNLPGQTQLKRIAQINEALNVREINIDATGVGVRLEEDMTRLFGAKVNGINFTNKEKEIMITNFRLLCEKRTLELVDDEEFISQLLSLERDYTPTGMIRYKHVNGKRDDRVWSACLACKDMMRPEILFDCELGDDSITNQLHSSLYSGEAFSVTDRDMDNLTQPF